MSRRFTIVILSSTLFFPAALIPSNHVYADEPPTKNLESSAEKHATNVGPLPKLTGKLVHMIGHEGGYVRPMPGEPFTLDLKDLETINKTLRLDFDPAKKSYIPFPAPLEIESIQRRKDGALNAMRLVSKSPPERRYRVVVDIIAKPGLGHGPNFYWVWVLIEYNQGIMGVAQMECHAEALPPRESK